MAYPWYRSGKITLTNNQKTVTGTGGTGWGNPAFVREGDALFRIASGFLTFVDEIASVTNNTSLELRNNYPGSTVSGQDYAIMPASLARSSVGALAYDISTFTQSLTLLVSGNGVPDNSLGENGWIYIREDVAEYYKKAAGSWGTPVSFAGPQGATGASYAATSTTSLPIGAGSKTLATQAGKAYVVGARVRVSSSASPTNYMEGIVTAYSGTSLSFTSDKIGGSGTFASWNINIAGDVGATGATGASFAATSTSSLAIGTGSKAFTTQAGLAYSAGQRVRAASAANVANYMEGVVASYSGTTLTLTIDRVGGSGTLADWRINLIGQPGVAGPGYAATSTTSRGIGTGAMSFTTQENLAYTVGARVRASYTADPSNYYMEGVVTGYSGTALSVTFDRNVGAGTFADWTINLAGDRGMTGLSYGGTSATSLLIATGSKALTTQSDLAYQAGSRVRAVSQANTANWMEGYVASYTGGVLTVTVDVIGGSGTFADWRISIAGTPGDASAALAAAAASEAARDDSVTAKDAAEGAASSAADNAVIAQDAAAALSLPSSFAGQGSKVLKVKSDESGYEFGAGGGDVVGPSVSVNNRIARFNGTTGKEIVDGGTDAALLAGIGAWPSTDIASAATTSLSSVNTPLARITGTTTITSLGTGNHLLRYVQFAGSLTLTQGASLQLPGAANIQTQPGDRALFQSDGSGVWTCVQYQRADGWVLSIRETLKAARGYYIRGDGSDTANTGLVNSSGGAFLTLQKALDVAGGLDSAIYNITINVAASMTFNAQHTLRPCAGSGLIAVVGGGSTTIVDPPSGVNHCFVSLLGGRFQLTNMKLQKTTATTGHAIYAEGGSSSILYSGIEFGAMNGGGGSGRHIYANAGARIAANGAYSITGGAAFHFSASSGGSIFCNQIVTLSGTPAFTRFADASLAGSMRIDATYSGAATGVRYLADTNGVIWVVGGGASFLPGNSAGSETNGGRYV